MTKHRRVAPFILLALGIALVAWLISYSGLRWENLVAQLRGIEPAYILVVCMLNLAAYGLYAYRWFLLVDPITDTSRFPRGFFYFYSSLGFVSSGLLSNAIGQIAVKSISLKVQNKVSMFKGSYIVVVEKILSVAALVVLVVPGFLFLKDWATQSQAIILMALLALVSYYAFGRHYRIAMRYLITPFKFLEYCIERLRILRRFRGLAISASLNEVLYVIKPSTARAVLMITLAAQLILGIEHYVIAESVNLSVPFISFLFLFMVHAILNGVSIVPGNLGISDISWFALLSIIVADKEQILIFVIADRLLLLTATWLAFLLGLGFYTVVNFKQRRRKELT